MSSFAVGSHRDSQCTNALLYMIAVDNLPFRAPEKKGLRKFVDTLQPHYKMPKEQECTRLLTEKYAVLRHKVMNWLAEAKWITLTTDLWTHTNTMRGYLGVTAHFRRDYKETTVELCARPMPQRKTIENITQVFREVCDEWGIDLLKVNAVVSDGGANMKGAVKNMFGSAKHVTCVAHIFNLIGQKAIENKQSVPSEDEPVTLNLEVEDDDFLEQFEETEATQNALRAVIFKLKKIVKFFRQSEVATGKLISAQMSQGNRKESECLKLIQEVRTRFNSCFEMIDRYLAIAPEVTRVLIEVEKERSSKAKPPAVLSADEDDILAEIKTLLAPLARATKEVSSDKTCTLSKVIPVVKTMKGDVNKAECRTAIGCDLKRQVLKLITEKLGMVEEVMMFAAATLLDPRFKTVGFSKDDKTPIRIANVVSFVGNLVKAKLDNSRTLMPTVEESRKEGAPKDDFWGDFDEEVAQHSATMSYQDMAGGFPVQYRSYLDLPCANRSTYKDSLDAWEPIKHEFHHVFSVAEEYLSTLATSIPSERLFSHAGNIATPIRSRMTPEHLNMRVFLQSCGDEF